MVDDDGKDVAADEVGAGDGALLQRTPRPHRLDQPVDPIAFHLMATG